MEPKINQSPMESIVEIISLMNSIVEIISPWSQ